MKSNPGSCDDPQRDAIQSAVEALVGFKRVFNRDLTPSILAELYVALELGLAPAQLCNQSGFDLMGCDGTRYQVKQRRSDVLNVDLNNFDFDYLVLVNLGDDYSLNGMWRLPVEAARGLFVFREKFRKYQATQKSVKAKAQLVTLRKFPQSREYKERNRTEAEFYEA
jgi:hypothetical protein